MKISFRNREESALSFVIVLSVAILVGCLWYQLHPVKRDLFAVQRARQKMSQEASNGVLLANQAKKDAAKQLTSLVWEVPSDQVGPEALKTIGKQASDLHLKVDAFRPQRVSVQDGLQVVPFQITLTGKFIDVLEFARKLETPDSKLAVSQVQISSADGNSDKVSGLISVTAYRNDEEDNG